MDKVETLSLYKYLTTAPVEIISYARGQPQGIAPTFVNLIYLKNYSHIVEMKPCLK